MVRDMKEEPKSELEKEMRKAAEIIKKTIAETKMELEGAQEQTRQWTQKPRRGRDWKQNGDTPGENDREDLTRGPREQSGDAKKIKAREGTEKRLRFQETA